MWLQFGAVQGPDGTTLHMSSSSMGVPFEVDAQVGTRLLVAGEHRGIAPKPEEGIAWNCGFTQPYTPQGAAVWESATARGTPTPGP